MFEFLIALAFSFVAVKLWQTERSARSGVEIQGTVVDEVTAAEDGVRVGGGSWRYAPRIEYTNPQTGKRETQLFKRYTVEHWRTGKTVSLYLHPETDEVVLPLRHGYLNALGFGAIAIFFFAIAVG